MNIIERANRRAELILPRLEAVRKTLGGGLYHEMSNHFTIVRNYHDLLLRPGLLDAEHIAEDLIHACDDAETFLLNLPRLTK